MKLKIRDMEAETDKVAENNFLDLLEISAKKNYFNELNLSI